MITNMSSLKERKGSPELLAGPTSRGRHLPVATGCPNGDFNKKCIPVQKKKNKKCINSSGLIGGV
jgi:hypothetical protein